VWLDAWEEAVGAVARTFVAEIDARLEREAAAARMPERIRREARLDDAESGAVAARLGSAGARLVPALDRFERAALQLATATARDRAVLAEWQEALATAGRRLEAAWLALEDQVERELAHWQGIVARTGAWRRSLWPVVAVALPALCLAGWLGLVLGGYLPAPDWLVAVWNAVTP